MAGKPHLGMDISPKIAGESLLVYSPIAGVCVRAGYAPNFGYHIRIKDALGRIFILAHLYAAPIIKQGSQVNEGAQIGWIGEHLHFEIRTSDQIPPPKGCRLNPAKEFDHG
jgi:murein DD-endopeptidase MepM/ murein hydrolase activator NlpD